MSSCGDGCGIEHEPANQRERRTLIIVLVINAGMFLAEFSAGLVSGSTALLADSLDMLADALIYAMGLFALNRAAHWRVRTAFSSGILQMLLGIGIAVEAVWKTMASTLPDTTTMFIFGAAALLANTISFFLLMRYRDGDINMRATWVCSRNDMIGNVGVLVAAALVLQTGSPVADIVIGLAIAAIVIRSAWSIVVEAAAKQTD